MIIVTDVRKMQERCLAMKRRGKSIGLVPTMGALHEGHLSLIRRCRKENDLCCVSIFVNPIQFGPTEDFNRYPRPVKIDNELCRREKVDLLFRPTPEGFYGGGFRTYVEVQGLGDLLCGASRKGHFRGVTTVVSKLFNVVLPDRAYFGRKDFQQTVVLRRMAEDLDFPVKIKVLPTVREPGGLAMSSRNAYLSERERADALVLSQSLRLARRMVKAGGRDSRKVIREMKELIRGRKSIAVEYIEAVDTSSLACVRRIVPGRTAIVLAARAGKTRLIDNILL